MNAIVPVQMNSAELYRTSTDAASLCKGIVVETAMAIQGRKYVRVEGWQAIAVAHGCTASARDVERVEGGVRAIGEIRRMSDGAIIAEAEGFVGEDEPTWYGGKVGSKTLPKRADYAIRAMAQTRAISRACRSAFAHVVVMMNAGLSTTPAEEVPLGGFDDEAPAPRNVTPAKAAAVKPEEDPIYLAATAAISICETVEDLSGWEAKNAAAMDALWSERPKVYEAVVARYQSRLAEVRAVRKPTPADDFGLNGDDVPGFD